MNNPIVNLFRYTWKYAADQKWRVVLFMSLAFVGNVIQLGNLWVVSRIFNNVQFSAGDPKLLRYVLFNVALLLGIELAFWIFNGTSRVIERRFHFVIRKNYKQDMFEKILALPAAWHKDHHSGDTIDKINTAGQSLYMFAGRIFFIIRMVVMLGGSMIILLFFDWRASLIAIAITATVIFFMFRLDKWLQKRYKILYKFENFFASAIHDYITNIMTIITLKLKQRVINEIDRRGLAGYPTHHAVELIDEVKWFCVSFSIALMISLSLAINAITSFNASGVIVIGTLFALYGYLQNVGSTFYTFAFRYGEIVRENAALEAASVIEDDYEKIEIKKTRRLPIDWKIISVNDLEFTYDDSIVEGNEEQKTGMKQLAGVSLDIKKGQRIALVGESGSGKSTLLSLLRGLYDPRSVKVSVDGTSMPYGLRHLSQHITLVPQEPEIFNSTIEDNITMEVQTTQEELDQSIDIARFRSVLAQLPHGLGTNVMEKGVSLSGGQKQRLALARGILAAIDSDMLFLDEPTSSVDAINEVHIYENILEAYPEKTIISTVHRLHLLDKFDRIYHFEDGKVIAQGSLHELLQTPKFKELWNKYHKNSESV